MACVLASGGSWGAEAGSQPAQGAHLVTNDHGRPHAWVDEIQQNAVPTNQVLSPLGRQITFPGRPTAWAMSPDGRWLGVLCHNQALIINLSERRIVGKAGNLDGSYTGIVFAPGGQTLLASSTLGRIEQYAVDSQGQLKKAKPIRLPPRQKGQSVGVVPAGLALDPDHKTLWVALNGSNSVAQIDLTTGKLLRTIKVGNAPFDVVCAAGKVYVRNWGGRRPAPKSPTGPSGLAPVVRVDPRCAIASEGSVSIVDPKQACSVKEIVVGAHSCALAVSPDARFVCVANANSDTVSVIDTRREEVVWTLSARLAGGLPLGSSPNGLAFSGDGKTLYVANGTNNALAVIGFDRATQDDRTRPGPPRAELPENHACTSWPASSDRARSPISPSCCCRTTTPRAPCRPCRHPNPRLPTTTLQ